MGDFPNVIYLLSMDRDVVTRALEEVHDCDGYEYLEKIIQVTFEIPELRKNKLHKVFFFLN
ncbi:P-loop NTPase fold protein [Lachnobacterium bovis]|uniref:P-loop NTPase fold protein n=1 Tax=Lachnobacterium bovis TaxID=140626 RepID=UPI001865917C|nr:P-loop NTPase fold protein [Lachnobacterium bovis]